MLNKIAMNETFQAILDSLPPKEPRSKLEPYAELTQELRKRGRSYREIVSILAERCGVRLGTHTVYNSVRVRASKKGKSGGGGNGRSGQLARRLLPTQPLPPRRTATTKCGSEFRRLSSEPCPIPARRRRYFNSTRTSHCS